MRSIWIGETGTAQADAGHASGTTLLQVPGWLNGTQGGSRRPVCRENRQTRRDWVAQGYREDCGRRGWHQCRCVTKGDDGHDRETRCAFRSWQAPQSNRSSPDLSLKRLTPTNHDDLLFDDVLWVERAQWEHDQFVKAMRDRGTEVYYHLDLLAEALAASEEARRMLIDMVASEYTVGWSLVDEVRETLWQITRLCSPNTWWVG